MSTTFQSCPKCESFILSDTFECPECGHVFDEVRANASQEAKRSVEMKDAEMYDTCHKCGESVRTGLVRCWSCNAFMRADVEARYRQMSASPQVIIFSDIPIHERTEMMPARKSDGTASGSNVYDAEDDDSEFSLRQSAPAKSLPQEPAKAQPVTPPQKPKKTAVPRTTADNDDGFELDAPKPTSVQKMNDGKKPPTKTAEAEANAPAKDATAPEPKVPESDGGSDVDDLVGIALADQRETRQKKRAKIEEAKRQRILLPCACGAWIRVHQDQAGRVVRCRQCKSQVVVPVMKRKEKEGRKQKQSAVDIKVTWLNDVRMHVIKPTDVVLKPGSLEKSHESVDVCFQDSGIHLVKFAAPTKKSFFSKATDGPPAVEEQRRLLREHIATTGKVADIPFGELLSISIEQIANIRLIQPVKEAHASMFAGVDVFGEGQIAIYLPLSLPENQQAFLSFPISVHRKIAEQLKSLFNFDSGAESNGVPVSEKYDTLKCHLSEMPVRSLKNVNYYQNDPAFEVELSGYICGTCGVAITEEARAKKKLGGAAGKGIAKAKCPKCSNKFGDQKAWSLAKAPDDEKPEVEEDVSEVLKAKPKAAETSAAAPAISADTLQGTWKMITLGQDGNFASPDNVSEANIVFKIEAENYTVFAGGQVQEKGTITLDMKHSPPHIDQKISDGADAGKVHRGIFRIVDGRLENCQGALDQPRPASFESTAGSTASLAAFERA